MIELVLRTPEPLVEPVSDVLVDECGAEAVTVEDADAGTGVEKALFGEPGMPAPARGWSRSTLRALFSDSAAADAAAARLLAGEWAEEVHIIALQAVPETDWVRLTQSQFEPVEVTPTFWIVPSWHDVPAGAREVIRLDPGLAFGTGTHATTRLCLRWIAQTGRSAGGWRRVLDYGCGSGILGIAAALHGAQAVDAVDIDPAACRASADNASANGVRLRVGAPSLAKGPYDLVLANILASPLKLLAPLLAEMTAPQGWLVLSGILERQSDEVAAAYAPHLAVQVAGREDGWVLMAGRRGPSSAGG